MRRAPCLSYIAFIGFAVLSGCAVQRADDGEQVESTSKPSAAPIIGGSKASAFPEAVLVDMYSGGSITSACSGSVIAPRVVLTAGHCVDGFSKWRITAPYASGQRVYGSSATTYDWAESGATSVNPNHHDIGLVFLDTPITLSQYPVLAATPVANGSSIINIGRIDNGSFSPPTCSPAAR